MDDAIASNQLNNTGRLSRVVHAARTKGRAVVSRGRKRNDEHSDPDSFSMESVSRVASDDFDGASINSEGEFGAMKDQPLRSRFAGVGQVTKGRLGSAFQAARQKRRELADRARRPRGTTTAIDSWSTDSADSTPVSRMGSTASGDTSIDGAQTGPRCRACTFINAVGAVNCEMCNSPLDVVATVAVIEEATGSSIDTFSDGAPFSQFLKETETEEGGSRPGIRERLGTAVRSVRKGAATLPDDETGSSVESGKTRSIFRPRSLQGGQDTGENSVGSGAEVIKLRNIRITGSLATETDPFGKPQIATIQPLKQIEANLFVEVTVRNKDTASRNQMRDSAKGEQVQTEDSTHVGFQFRSDEAVHEAPATDRAHSKRKAGDQPDSAAIEVEAEQLPRFQLQVFRQGLEGSEVELIAEIEKDIVSLLSLHTAISECVAQLPFSAYCDYYPSRTTSSDMSNSLASTLGLNAVETTRITGRILGGLMAESLRDESKLLSSQTCEYHILVLAFLRILFLTPSVSGCQCRWRNQRVFEFDA